MTTLKFGHRRDPDDAFKFAGLARGHVKTGDLTFEVSSDETEALFEQARDGAIDVVSLSVPAYAELADRYRPLTSGGSSCDGEGPLIVSNRVFIEDELGAETTIVVPGVHNTGRLVMRLYAPSASEQILRPPSAVLPAVVDGTIETAVLIDDSQITVGNFGMYKVEDLGEWWQLNHDSLPLPLDLICVRRDLDEDTQRAVERAVRASVVWGMEHQEEALAHAKDLGRDVDPYAAQRVIAIYVNALTRELGEDGRRGLERLLERAAEAGLIPRVPAYDPVPNTAS